MQTVETLNEGLKRAYTLTITAKDIDDRVEAEVKSVAPQIKMPGFRPGKVPTNLIRKMHGPALQQDALNKAVQESVQSLLTEQKLRPAMQPAVELEPNYEPGKDAELSVTLEVLPEVPAPAIDGLTLERLQVEPAEEAIAEQIGRIADQQKQYDETEEGYEAKTGDLVVMDFAGKVDGVAFDGGTGEGMSIEIGSGRLIPGFEDQLVGVKKGESRTLNVKFPDDYNVDTLKGQDATFDITATEVKTPKETVADDEFAKSLGLEGIDQLKGLIKDQLANELNGLTRTHMKRKLLDQLADRHDFEVPPSMVEAEFQQIWRQLDHEASHEADPEAARAEMENDREDYLKIAERRVRLGLLLSEIGQQNGVEVSQQEMNRLIAQAAQQYRGEDQRRFIEYVQQEPMAAAQLRAPLYEDKVVDFLFEKAEITDRAVSREELEAAIEAEDDTIGKGHVHGPDCGHDHHDHDHASHDHASHDHADHDHAHEEKAAKPKKAALKKAETEADTATVTEEAAAEAIEEKAAAKPKKAAAKKATADDAAADEEAPAKPKRAKKAAADTAE